MRNAISPRLAMRIFSNMTGIGSGFATRMIPRFSKPDCGLLGGFNWLSAGLAAIFLSSAMTG
jgi:hypothetical protein